MYGSLSYLSIYAFLLTMKSFFCIVCNFPRVLLDIYEAVNVHQLIACAAKNQEQFPFWTWISLSVSHFLLVVNSSINVVVYCLLGSKFRNEFLKIFDAFAYRTGCRKRRRHGFGNHGGRR